MPDLMVESWLSAIILCGMVTIAIVWFCDRVKQQHAWEDRYAQRIAMKLQDEHERQQYSWFLHEEWNRRGGYR